MSAFVDRHRNEILRVAEEHGAVRVRVFGSLARGEGSEFLREQVLAEAVAL